jgi:hypothetical protein
VVWPKFSKIKKQKLLVQISKTNSNFPCGINDFFLSPRLPNLSKGCKNYIFTLTKNSHILHTTPLVVWSTVKELKKERKGMENFRTCKQTSVEL